MAHPAKLSVECSATETEDTYHIATSLSSNLPLQSPPISDNVSPVVTTVHLDQTQKRSSIINLPAPNFKHCCSDQPSTSFVISVQLNNADVSKDSPAASEGNQSSGPPKDSQEEQYTLKVLRKHIYPALTIILLLLIIRILLCWEQMAENIYNVNSRSGAIEQELQNCVRKAETIENILNLTLAKYEKNPLQKCALHVKTRQSVESSLSQTEKVFPKCPKAEQMCPKDAFQVSYADVRSFTEDKDALSNLSSSQSYHGRMSILSLQPSTSVPKTNISKSGRVLVTANVPIQDTPLNYRYSHVQRDFKSVVVHYVNSSHRQRYLEELDKQHPSNDINKSSMTQDWTSLSMQGDSACKPAMKSMNGAGLINVDLGLGILEGPVNTLIQMSILSTSLFLTAVTLIVQLWFSMNRNGFLTSIKVGFQKSWISITCMLEQLCEEAVAVVLLNCHPGMLGVMFHCLMYCPGFQQNKKSESTDSGILDSESIVCLSTDEKQDCRGGFQKQEQGSKTCKIPAVYNFPKTDSKSYVPQPSLKCDPDHTSPAHEASEAVGASVSSSVDNRSGSPANDFTDNDTGDNRSDHDQDSLDIPGELDNSFNVQLYGPDLSLFAEPPKEDDPASTQISENRIKTISSDDTSTDILDSISAAGDFSHTHSTVGSPHHDVGRDCDEMAMDNVPNDQSESADAQVDTSETDINSADENPHHDAGQDPDEGTMDDVPNNPSEATNSKVETSDTARVDESLQHDAGQGPGEGAMNNVPIIPSEAADSKVETSDTDRVDESPHHDADQDPDEGAMKNVPIIPSEAADSKVETSDTDRDDESPQYDACQDPDEGAMDNVPNNPSEVANSKVQTSDTDRVDESPHHDADQDPDEGSMDNVPIIPSEAADSKVETSDTDRDDESHQYDACQDPDEGAMDNVPNNPSEVANSKVQTSDTDRVDESPHHDADQDPDEGSMDNVPIIPSEAADSKVETSDTDRDDESHQYDACQDPDEGAMDNVPNNPSEAANSKVETSDTDRVDESPHRDADQDPDEGSMDNVPIIPSEAADSKVETSDTDRDDESPQHDACQDPDEGAMDNVPNNPSEAADSKVETSDTDRDDESPQHDACQDPDEGAMDNVPIIPSEAANSKVKTFDTDRDDESPQHDVCQVPDEGAMDNVSIIPSEAADSKVETSDTDRVDESPHHDADQDPDEGAMKNVPIMPSEAADSKVETSDTDRVDESPQHDADQDPDEGAMDNVPNDPFEAAESKVEISDTVNIDERPHLDAGQGSKSLVEADAAPDDLSEAAAAGARAVAAGGPLDGPDYFLTAGGNPLCQENVCGIPPPNLSPLLEAVKERVDKYDILAPESSQDKCHLSAEVCSPNRQYVRPHNGVIHGVTTDMMNFLLGITSAPSQTGVFLRHFQLFPGDVVKVLSESRKLCVDQRGETPYIEEQIELGNFLEKKRLYERYICDQDYSPGLLKIYGVTKSITENGCHYVSVIYECREKIEYINILIVYKPPGCCADGQWFRVHKGLSVKSVLTLPAVIRMVTYLKERYPALKPDHFIRLGLLGCQALASPTWKLNNTCILELIPTLNKGRCPVG